MRSLIAVLLLSAYQTCLVSGQSSGSREDAFIGYSERARDCEDRLDRCRDRAKGDGCLLDPYNMRNFCPITCGVSRCLMRGTYRVRHEGFATADDTSAFSKHWLTRIQNDPSADSPERHFRSVKLAGTPLQLSSLGVGTYLGNEDARTDDAVAAAVIYSVMRGWNVIDTASNYRGGRAETSVGAALESLLAGRQMRDFKQEPAYLPDVTRSMLFISTKAGFTDPELVRQLTKANRLTQRDVVSGHTLAPAYIEASVNASLERMNLETVDLLYLHNPAEMQLRGLGWDAFRQKLKKAFRTLETLRTAGALRFYGLATWDCFRVPPTDPGHVSLEEVVALAAEAAREANAVTSGFAAVQLPVSATMREAWGQPWQRVGNDSLTLMRAAERLAVAVFTSGPLGEGDLPRKLTSLLDSVVELRLQATTPQKLLQLARSTPGSALASTLVGHKTREYVVANIRLGLQGPLTESSFRSAMEQVEVILEGPRGGAHSAAESL